MKVIFLGTPDFAAICLERLLKSQHRVVAVVTQPDRERNRRKITYSPVKEVALRENIKVLQYEKISREGIDDLKQIDADIMVTSAFGQILSQEVLNITKYGVINTHASLLPKYRGSSPIQWAIINGDKKTGVTIMQTEKGVDCGDIILQKETDISEDETAGELFDRLASLAAESLVEALDLIERGKAKYIKQDETKATKCTMLTKSSGLIDFNKDPITLFNFIKGVNPWPSAFAYMGKKIFKIWKCKPVIMNVDKENGELFVNGSELYLACNGGCLLLEEIQLEGSKRMSASAFLCGRKLDGVKLFSEE